MAAAGRNPCEQSHLHAVCAAGAQGAGAGGMEHIHDWHIIVKVSVVVLISLAFAAAFYLTLAQAF
jgi:hypothetical protein